MPKQIRNWKRREHRLYGFHHSDFFRISGFGIRVFLSSAICEGLTKAGKSSRNNWPPSPGCPAWIRTRTKASKGPCATVTPPDKPLQISCVRLQRKPIFESNVGADVRR